MAAAVGVPESAFPSHGAVAEFQVQTLNVCCTGSSELLAGSMRSTAAGYELEIDWGSIGDRFGRTCRSRTRQSTSWRG